MDFGQGGGLRLEGSDAILRDNTISANTAGGRTGQGGGLYLSNCNAQLDDNLITGNTSTNKGGGLYLNYGDALLTNNVIANNQATENGSGSYLFESVSHWRHTTLVHNTGNQGIYVDGGVAVPVFTNTVLVSHTVALRPMSIAPLRSTASCGLIISPT